ncbi:MAG: aspartate aminotransferase family protein [Rhodocyclaceae bacterium]|nr:aspartate aminotransferase family protein [Rhodocyclaceae bacterium]MBX3669401.1 aspartate aminotransferase family protein [Rhodocyclaceae bacterium]
MPHLMNTYGRQPVAFTHGAGVRLYDENGRAYLDALAGIAVSTLGHAHPDLVRALADQAGRLLHTSNLYRIREQEALSDRLASISGMAEAFFCNSGCEANEAAIKLARLYGHQRGVQLPGIVVMEQAFHGRTLATLSATGNRKVQAGFEPLTPGFVRVPFNDLAAVESVAAHNPAVVAVLVEPVQGEGGINIAHLDYLRALRSICDARGWLLMFDEVQCGIGRTGKWFAHQHAGILPDVMTLAKGLGSGIPIGACLAAGAALGVFKPGNHGSTFGGNSMACRAAVTTLDVIERDGLMENALRQGNLICSGLRAALQGVAGVREVRGDGLMIGVELDRPCAELVGRARERGVLINVTVEKVVRLLPPLIFGDADSAELVALLAAVIREFLQA